MIDQDEREAYRYIVAKQIQKDIIEGAKALMSKIEDQKVRLTGTDWEMSLFASLEPTPGNYNYHAFSDLKNAIENLEDALKEMEV